VNIITPRLEIFPERIVENARAVIGLCHQNSIQVACVTKVTCAHPSVVHALEEAGADLLADSRLENLQSIRNSGSKLPLLLLRIPSPDQAEDVVRFANISLNSSAETIRKLSSAAVVQNVVHKVILMIDLGDLREGIWPDRTSEVLQSIIHLPNIEVSGLGCNLTCYGGVIPTTEKMQFLVDLREKCRQETGLELNTLSGGNSANLPLLASGGMPKEINQIRIGETILLGRNVLDRSPWPNTRQDTFRIVSQIVEMEKKPSIPVGDRGQDAFGGLPEFVDRGIRTRVICNIGRQDIVVDNLEPEDPGIRILGGSSDHLILDVEESTKKIGLGDEIAFYPGYAALLSASTSSYVRKTIREG
jgi:predicted amino acid racemase